MALDLLLGIILRVCTDTKVSNMQSIERQSVEDFLGEEALKISHQNFADGVLAVWRNVHSFPTRRICTFIERNGSVSIPNESDDEFYCLLERAVMEGVDLQLLCEIISLASPVSRKPIFKLQPYLQYLADTWHAPKLQQGLFECFVENLASGRVERLSIDASGHQTVDVGEGIQFSIR